MTLASTGRPRFLITIDTEGDNLWARPSSVTTENVRFLPRFQALCERFGLKPTYLTNYEMAKDDRFVAFAKAVEAAGAGEVGMHLHAWNSPPIRPLTPQDDTLHPFLTEFPADRMAEKVEALTVLLEERFGHKMTSHRGGRWAFNEVYARILIEQGYLIDCSVTPHVDWRRRGEAAAGLNGPDFTGFPQVPYWIDPCDIRRAGASSLLEAPMTIRTAARPINGWSNSLPGVRGILARRQPARRWLRPNGANTEDMIRLAAQVLDEGAPYAMFMLHSSEFMPGGSPSFPTADAIERLYASLQALFDYVSRRFEAATLTEFRRLYMQS